MKKIFILTPLIILLCLFGVYFLFPGVMFDLLKTAERSAAGLDLIIQFQINPIFRR